ncbi:MAG: hypothetical protein KDA29_01665 [Phycisphaerales bacterium]|nr:hypothetical protein [Phycisphaerales bacterium]
MRLQRPLCLISATILFTGCTQNRNERIAMGGSYIPPSFSTSQSFVDQHDDEPFLFEKGFPDRGVWSPTQFVAHFDGTVHAHSMVLMPPLSTKMAARAYGRFPEDGDVLDPQSHSWGEDMWETVRELGRSTIGSVFAVGYLTWNNGLGQEQVSPRPYKRTQQDEWASGMPDPKTTGTDDE